MSRPKDCAYCNVVTEELIKSKVADVYICFDCVDGISELMELDSLNQKIIKMADYKMR